MPPTPAHTGAQQRFQHRQRAASPGVPVLLVALGVSILRRAGVALGLRSASVQG